MIAAARRVREEAGAAGLRGWAVGGHRLRGLSRVRLSRAAAGRKTLPEGRLGDSGPLGRLGQKGQHLHINLYIE